MAEWGTDKVNADARMRRLPYPYRAMLSICSDLDGTPDRQVYRDITRFLNTTDQTAMGRGVGLEIGNSIHFRAIPQRYSYWDTDDVGRDMARRLIRSGHIDCLHSFGECLFTRHEAAHALAELQEHGCHLEVWVDHGGAVTNFCPTSPRLLVGHGDDTGHAAYHADLTVDYGIKYVWLGRITSTLGQDIPAQLGGIFKLNHPFASGRTLLKEAIKRIMAKAGNETFAMHGPNDTLRLSKLRDGSPVYEFLRCNPHWGGICSCDQGRHIGKVLNAEMLDRLVQRGANCVLYTHLGRIDDPAVPFNREAVAAFSHLAEEFHTGRILVTTTRRMLGYLRAIREIDFDCTSDAGGLCINLNTKSKETVGPLSNSDLDGLTFYVQNPQQTRMTVDGREVTNLQHNVPDHSGVASVSLAWPRLEFPDI